MNNLNFKTKSLIKRFKRNLNASNQNIENKYSFSMNIRYLTLDLEFHLLFILHAVKNSLPKHAKQYINSKFQGDIIGKSNEIMNKNLKIDELRAYLDRKTSRKGVCKIL